MCCESTKKEKTQHGAGRWKKGCFGKLNGNDGVGICVNSWMMWK